MTLFGGRDDILKRIEDHLAAPFAVGVKRLHRLHRLCSYSIEAKRTVFVDQTAGQTETRRAGVLENARLESTIVVMVVVQFHYPVAEGSISEYFHVSQLRPPSIRGPATHSDLFCAAATAERCSRQLLQMHATVLPTM